MLKEILDFQPSAQFFESIKEAFIRALVNEAANEPYMVAEKTKHLILETNRFENSEFLAEVRTMEL